MRNRSGNAVLIAAALFLSACSSDDGERTANDGVVSDAPATNIGQEPENEAVGIDNAPAADAGREPAAVPAAALEELPGAIDGAAAADPAADDALPYLPNCWPLHECMIED